MKQHHTKIKGDIGVLKVKCDLVTKGYFVGSLDTEHCPFDIIAYKDKEFKRIQVKYRKVNSKGALDIVFRSSWADKHGTHAVSVDKSEVDIYAVYCPDTDTCYYFDPDVFNKTVTLRVSTPLNNQTTNIKFVDDYREVP